MSDICVDKSIGGVLRQARERAGLSLKQASLSVKFSPGQIEALEAGNYSALPATQFLRAFVRNYATLLQIDPAPLLASLPQQQSSSGVHPLSVPIPYRAEAIPASLELNVGELREMDQSRHKLPAINVLLYGASVGVATAAIVLACSLKFVQPAPVPVPVASARAVLAAPVSVLHLAFSADAWADIKDKNGKTLLSQLNPASTEQNIIGAPPLSVVIGYAKTVNLSYNGTPVDLTPFVKDEIARLVLK